VIESRDMSEQRSIIAFEHYREGEQRFEYFITGISTALCAYVGQTLQPQKFGFNPYTLEVLSLALVVASIIFGFKRIEIGIWLHQLNHALLHMGEVRGTLISNPQGFINELTGDVLTPEEISNRIAQINKDLPTAQRKIKIAKGKILKYYHWRNWLLLCGFLGLFISKILVPYVN
jgi:hypothetical protein